MPVVVEARKEPTLTIDLKLRDQVDAAMAGEELIERVTVVRALAMILLPLPRQVGPTAEPLSAALELAS